MNGIAWTEVARLLNNARYPIDYNRRWPRIIKKYTRGENESKRVDITLPMLNYLHEK